MRLYNLEELASHEIGIDKCSDQTISNDATNQQSGALKQTRVAGRGKVLTIFEPTILPMDCVAIYILSLKISAVGCVDPFRSLEYVGFGVGRILRGRPFSRFV